MTLIFLRTDASFMRRLTDIGASLTNAFFSRALKICEITAYDRSVIKVWTNCWK
jgi:hypothetical protein